MSSKFLKQRDHAAKPNTQIITPDRSGASSSFAAIKKIGLEIHDKRENIHNKNPSPIINIKGPPSVSEHS